MQKKFEEMTYADFRHMKKADLKSLVAHQASRLNKRISRIQENPSAYQGAVENVLESGGRFSVKGKKTHRELVREAVRERNFLRQEGSTLRSARKISLKIKESFKNVSLEKGFETQIKEYQAFNRGKSTSKESFYKEFERFATGYHASINSAWEAFHRAIEENPALTYSKSGVKSAIEEYVIQGGYDFKSLFDSGEEISPEWEDVSDEVFDLFD